MLFNEVESARGVTGTPGLPPELQASVQRHQEHLGALVVSLRAVGIDESIVEASVKQLLASYGDELTAAMRNLAIRSAND